MRLYLSLTLTLSCLGCAVAGCGRHDETAYPGAAQTAGERIFEGSCAPCHQRDGLGVPGAYPSLAGSALVVGEVDPLAAWVLEGRRPPFWPAGRYSTVMPTFGWIKDDDAASLFTYLRSHFGNSAPAVDAAQVRRSVEH